MSAYNDMHVGDMAEELAEHAYNSMPLRELLDKYVDVEDYDRELASLTRMAWFNVRREWMKKAEAEPDTIREMYANFRGVPIT